MAAEGAGAGAGGGWEEASIDATAGAASPFFGMPGMVSGAGTDFLM